MRNYFSSFFWNILDDKDYMQYNITRGSVKAWVRSAGELKTLSICPGITMTGIEL